MTTTEMDTSMEEIPNLPDNNNIPEYDITSKTNTTMDTEAPSDDDDSGTNVSNPNMNNGGAGAMVTALPPLPEVKRTGFGGRNATGCTDEECFVFASAFANFFNVLKRKQIMEVPVQEEEEEQGYGEESVYTDDESRNMSVISLDVTTTDGEEEEEEEENEEEDGIVNVGGDVEDIGQVVTSGSMKSVVSPSSSSSSSAAVAVATVAVTTVADENDSETPGATVEEEATAVLPTETTETIKEGTPTPTIESVSRDMITTSESKDSKDSKDSSSTTKSKKERNFQWGKKSIKKLRQSHLNRKNRKRNASMSVSFSEDGSNASGVVGATPDAVDVESDVPVNDSSAGGGVLEQNKKKRKSWKKRLSKLRKSSKEKTIAE